MTLEQLDDYVSGFMDGEAADRFEEALFAAAAQGTAVEAHFLAKLRASIADLARRGSYEVTLTLAEVDALRRRPDLQVRVFDPVADAQLDHRTALEDLDLAVFDLRVKLEGVARVDLELGYGEQTLMSLPDVKVDREHDRVFLCCEGELARLAFRPGTFTKVFGVESSERRLLARYEYAPGPTPR